MTAPRIDPTAVDGNHLFARTIDTDGTWCQRCGLPSARWAGESCPGFTDTTLRDIEAVFVARYASRRDLLNEADRIRRHRDLIVRSMLRYADEVDHPDHYNNEEHEETCRTCHGWTGLRASWPCSYHNHAEAIRRIARTKETPA